MAKRPALGTPLLMDIIENRSYFDTLDDEVGQLIKKIDPLQKQSVYRQAKNDLFKYVTRHRGAMLRFRKQRLALESHQQVRYAFANSRQRLNGSASRS